MGSLSHPQTARCGAAKSGNHFQVNIGYQQNSNTVCAKDRTLPTCHHQRHGSAPKGEDRPCLNSLFVQPSMSSFGPFSFVSPIEEEIQMWSALRKKKKNVTLTSPMTAPHF